MVHAYDNQAKLDLAGLGTSPIHVAWHIMVGVDFVNNTDKAHLKKAVGHWMHYCKQEQAASWIVTHILWMIESATGYCAILQEGEKARHDYFAC